MDYYAPDGEKFRFDTVGRFLLSFTGFGMPGIDYITQRGPFQHGHSIYDYRLEPRVVQLQLRENGCSRADYWDNRANILNLLRPNRQVSLTEFGLGTLRIHQANGDDRALDVFIEEGPKFAARQLGRWDEFAMTETLRFIAPDPTFYDPTQESESWAPEAADHLVLPFTFDDEDMAFSWEDAESSFTVTYPGTWLTYPRIVITGPLDDFVVDNLTTDEKLDLTGYNIADGETVTIDLTFGYKTITSSVGGNIIGELTSDSDLATFHISPAPMAPGGVNNISFSGDNDGVNTSVTMTYYTRYIGI